MECTDTDSDNVPLTEDYRSDSCTYTESDGDDSEDESPTRDGHTVMVNDMQNLCLEAKSLLGFAQAQAEQSVQIQAEMQSTVEAWSWSPCEAMIHVLSTPFVLVPEGCDTLEKHLQSLTEHNYSARMRATTYSKSGRDNAKVEAGKKEWRRRDGLRVVSEMSMLVRRKDRRAIPPLTLMRSIDSVFGCLSKPVWERQCNEQYLLGRKSTLKYLKMLQDWKAPAVFPLPEDVTSTRYALAVYDNLEFSLRVEFEKIVDGEMKRTNLLHTVTSEYEP